MSKRKNDEYSTPLWVWLLVPVVLVGMVGLGVVIGQWVVLRQQAEIPTPTPRVVTATPVVTAIHTFPTHTYTPTPTPFQPTAVPNQGGITCTGTCLDVTILIDTTGSMGDEIAQLQNNFTVIAGQIATDFPDVDVRYGLVAYRDRGDEYLTDVRDFTRDVTLFQANLNTLWADGGGDNPEDLAAGLEATLTQLSWRGDDTVKLVFLVADAPAQLYGGFSYTDGMKQAAARGIKIHSIASSGLDQPGEFTLRQIAQFTMGKFIFLTYDESTPTGGAPGEVRPDLNVGEPEDAQGVGEYTVEQLDDLVLKLIQDELAALRDETAVLEPTSVYAGAGWWQGQLPCTPLEHEPDTVSPYGAYIQSCTSADMVIATQRFYIVGHAYVYDLLHYDTRPNQYTLSVQGDIGLQVLAEYKVPNSRDVVYEVIANRSGQAVLELSAHAEIYPPDQLGDVYSAPMTLVVMPLYVST